MIDQLSHQFMKWVELKMSSDDFYQTLLQNLPKRAEEYFQKNPDVIRKRLMEKLQKGAQEHGAPLHEQAWLQHELENEFIDMIGYSLLMLWNYEYKQNHTDTTGK